MKKTIICYITVEPMQFARLATNATNLVAIVTKRSALVWKKRKIVSKKGCGFHMVRHIKRQASKEMILAGGLMGFGPVP